MNMQKILCVASHLSTGGMPQVLAKRLEMLKDYYDIYVIEYHDISPTFVVQKNRIKRLVKPNQFFTLGDDKTEILRLIEKIKPDIIHFEEIPEDGSFHMDYDIAYKIYDTRRSYKIFETTHSSDFDVNNKIFLPDKFVFVSQFNSFRYAKLGIPITVVEYPTDPISREDRDKYRKELGFDPEYIHFVNVGLFTPRKNQAYAFELARVFEKTGDKVKFHFIGNHADNFKFYWEPLLKNVPRNCKIWNERSDTHKFYVGSDIFLFTSRGFKTDKELNPLVIKEALSAGMPLIMFPLDVYCSKYDNDPQVTYLDGDLYKDVEIIRQVIEKFKSGAYENIVRDVKDDYEYVESVEVFDKIVGDEVKKVQVKVISGDNKENQRVKYNVKAVHLLLENDERNIPSTESMKIVKDYGIEYIQHINQRYTEIPPRETSARPNDVGRIGPYSLNGPHYGNYQSFRKAIEIEFTNDVDFLMIFEGDCTLTVSPDKFMEILNNTLDIMNQYEISYMSLGNKRNLMTGEVVSDVVNRIPNVDWMYITNKIIGIQCIIFSKNCRNFLLETYKTRGWDVSDLYFNDIFPSVYKKGILHEPITTQMETKSLIDGLDKKHYNNRENSQLTSDDIEIQFNTNDKKLYVSLKDVYRNYEGFILIRDQSNVIIFESPVKFGAHEIVWFDITNIENYGKLNVGIADNQKRLLFFKEVVINENKSYDYGNIDELKSFVIDKFNETDVQLRYEDKENKILINYNGKKELEIDIKLKILDNQSQVFETTLGFKPGYEYFIIPPQYVIDQKNIIEGFTLDFYDFRKDEFVFSKDLKIGRATYVGNVYKDENIISKMREDNKKSSEVQDYLYDAESRSIENFINNSKKIIKTDEELFIISTYPNTKIKEQVTIDCINSLKSAGRKILLSSHIPVSQELQGLVDYFVCDNYNPVIDHSYYRYAWYSNYNFKIDIDFSHLNNVGKNQSLTVYNNIYNSISLANKLGFKRIFSVTYDYIFSDSDLTVFDDISNRLNSSNKEGYLMKFSDNGMDTIKTVFFVINTDSFLRNFDNIRTPENFNQDCDKIGSQNFLENYFFHRLKNNLNNFLVEETTEELLFSNSNINIFSECEYLTVVPVVDRPDLFAIWYNSSNKIDDRMLRVNINKNDQFTQKFDFNVLKGESFYKVVKKEPWEKFEVVFEFFDNGKKYRDDVSHTIQNIEELSKNGKFAILGDIDIL